MSRDSLTFKQYQSQMGKLIKTTITEVVVHLSCASHNLLQNQPPVVERMNSTPSSGQLVMIALKKCLTDLNFTDNNK